jgi:hypothetical protein
MASTSTPTPLPSGPPQAHFSRGTIIATAVGGGVALSIFLLLFYLIIRDRNYRNRGENVDMSMEDQPGSEGLRPAIGYEGVQIPNLHKTEPQDKRNDSRPTTAVESRKSSAKDSRDSSLHTLALPKRTGG